MENNIFFKLAPLLLPAMERLKNTLSVKLRVNRHLKFVYIVEDICNKPSK